MNNLETQLNAETLHEMDSKSALSVIKAQFERFINFDLLKPLDIYSRSFSSNREVRENFRDYTKMTTQTFKETIIQNMNSIEQCIVERASHEQELKMTLKKLSERQLQIQQCKVQEVQSSVTSSGDETSSGIVSDEAIDKKELEAHYSFMAKIQEVLPAESKCTDERATLGQLKEKSKVISDLKVKEEKDIDKKVKEEKDIDEMIEMDKQLKFLNEIVYTRNQFAPDTEETMTLDNESRSKLDKDTVKPYDYTRQNSLYEIFKAPSLEYLYQLERAKEVRKTIQECECLAQKLSKQTESVHKEVHNKLLKSFAKLENHSISLELSLQQCKEQMKNNSVCKENGSNVFRKEREQYHEIQDLKAQMQDKNIAISELKKLIEKCKGKSVETQFDKPSVVRQPNAQRIPKPSVLGKPQFLSVFGHLSSFLEIRKQAVQNTNVIAPGPSRNHPKHVSFQSPKEFVGSKDMVHNYYLEKAKKSSQLQKDKDVNGKPSMINSARLPNTANGCKPKPRNWQASMSSRILNKDVHIEGEYWKQKPFLKSNDLRCPTCKKCLFSANHNECVLEYLSKLNPRASAQNKDTKSHKTTKRYMPVEKTKESKRPERQIPSRHRFSKKKTTTVLEKTMTPRSCLSEPTHGSIIDIPHIHACKQTLGLSAGTSFNGQKQQRIDLNADALYNAKQENLRVWLLKMLISKKPVPECHKVVRLGINPMIQPELKDLPKDNPKLEIAVLSTATTSELPQHTSNKNVDTTLSRVQEMIIRTDIKESEGSEFVEPKQVKDSTYHKEKMLLCKQSEKGVQLQAEQSD
ncbi:hypothetical protein Tco_0270408 [Tanacetum coccineum]